MGLADTGNIQDIHLTRWPVCILSEIGSKDPLYFNIYPGALVLFARSTSANTPIIVLSISLNFVGRKTMTITVWLFSLSLSSPLFPH